MTLFGIYCDYRKALTTFSSSKTKSLDKITSRIYDDYNLIALQDLDTNDFDGCEFSNKFRAETCGDMDKLMACVGH